MQAHVRNARALSRGLYDFEGPNKERYGYVDLYDQDRGEVVRLSLDKDATCPDIPDEGLRVDVWVAIGNADKIVGSGRDARVFGHLKLRALDVRPAESVIGVAETYTEAAA